MADRATGYRPWHAQSQRLRLIPPISMLPAAPAAAPLPASPAIPPMIAPLAAPLTKSSPAVVSLLYHFVQYHSLRERSLSGCLQAVLF